MNSRSMLYVPMVNVSLLSSSTSTAVPTAVDLANYFPVGKREVKFVIGIINSSTALDTTATVTLEECASTSTASFTGIVTSAGATAAYTSTANASTSFEVNAIVNYRYVRAKYVGTTSTGGTFGIVVGVLPLVRAA